MPMITLSGGPFASQELSFPEVKQEGDVLDVHPATKGDATSSRYIVNADTSTATFIDTKTPV